MPARCCSCVPAARSPIVVLQLLALPVAYSLWFQAGVAVYGAPIMLAALATLFLLFTPPAREALDRDLATAPARPSTGTRPAPATRPA